MKSKSEEQEQLEERLKRIEGAIAELAAGCMPGLGEVSYLRIIQLLGGIEDAQMS